MEVQGICERWLSGWKHGTPDLGEGCMSCPKWHGQRMAEFIIFALLVAPMINTFLEFMPYISLSN